MHRHPFHRSRVNELEEDLDIPTTKSGRFKVIIEPHVKDDTCEWWVEVQDEGERVRWSAHRSKESAEAVARASIKSIKEREIHELQEGVEWEED